MNQTAPTLQEYQENATITAVNNPWTLENGLLKHQSRLAVPVDSYLRTRLIKEAHA